MTNLEIYTLSLTLKEFSAEALNADRRAKTWGKESLQEQDSGKKGELIQEQYHAMGMSTGYTGAANRIKELIEVLEKDSSFQKRNHD